MMSAFAIAVGALFADPNIGVAATYTPDGGAPLLVRVVARRADAVSDFRDARRWSETTRIDMRSGHVVACHLPASAQPLSRPAVPHLGA